jgi:hypothetical protein
MQSTSERAFTMSISLRTVSGVEFRRMALNIEVFAILQGSQVS